MESIEELEKYFEEDYAYIQVAYTLQGEDLNVTEKIKMPVKNIN